MRDSFLSEMEWKLNSLQLNKLKSSKAHKLNNNNNNNNNKLDNQESISHLSTDARLGEINQKVTHLWVVREGVIRVKKVITVIRLIDEKTTDYKYFFRVLWDAHHTYVESYISEKRPE